MQSKLVKKQMCPTCKTTFETCQPGELWAWCPKCFKEARINNQKFIPVKLVEASNEKQE